MGSSWGGGRDLGGLRGFVVSDLFVFEVILKKVVERIEGRNRGGLREICVSTNTERETQIRHRSVSAEHTETKFRVRAAFVSTLPPRCSQMTF